MHANLESTLSHTLGQALADLIFGDAVRTQAWLHEIDQGYFA